MAVNGVALATGGAGVVLLWSALVNQKITTVLQDVISGKKPAPGPETAAPSDTPSTASGGSGGGSAAAAPSNPTGNVALGKTMAASRGWTGAQWNALYALWQRESEWSNTAENAQSGAYGIAQALGHGPTNQYPAGPANPPTSSAAAQIEWGLGYIASKFGNPVNALAHENQFGWY